MIIFLNVISNYRFFFFFAIGKQIYCKIQASGNIRGIKNENKEIDEQFNLLCTYNFFAQGELVKYEETEAVEGALVGIYAATFIHPKNGFEFLMELVFAADGTGTYSLMNNAYEGTFKYTNAEGVITFSEVTAIFGADVELSATIADNVITAKTVFTDAGNELELEYTGGSAVQEEATTTPVVGENVVFVSMMGTELIFTPEESGSYTISIDGTIAGILIGFGIGILLVLFLPPIAWICIMGIGTVIGGIKF